MCADSRLLARSLPPPPASEIPSSIEARLSTALLQMRDSIRQSAEQPLADSFPNFRPLSKGPAPRPFRFYLRPSLNSIFSGHPRNPHRLPEPRAAAPRRPLSAPLPRVGPRVLPLPRGRFRDSPAPPSALAAPVAHGHSRESRRRAGLAIARDPLFWRSAADGILHSAGAKSTFEAAQRNKLRARTRKRDDIEGPKERG
jgi:hypothetical protein